MNKYQWITLAVAAVNLALVGLFPPFDYVPLSPGRATAAAFDGFRLVFSDQPNRVVNASFLQLEIIVILANAAIAWLLLKERPRANLQKKVDWQKVILAGVALNLLLVLLFPPMENTYALTRSALPSFDGFYFVFGEYGKRAIVTQMLYIEVFFILINGALLYLLLRRTGSKELSAEARAALLAELRKSRR